MTPPRVRRARAADPPRWEKQGHKVLLLVDSDGPLLRIVPDIGTHVVFAIEGDEENREIGWSRDFNGAIGVACRAVGLSCTRGVIDAARAAYDA